ncbi:glycosyltransferase family 4 protein [Halopenitus salinus]|uniref:Glycosyltransferase family 4 protein n=1 Tax=Halopenitus salinus TaxID=1198295 RepID=A0ABD5URX6_9EURY
MDAGSDPGTDGTSPSRIRTDSSRSTGRTSGPSIAGSLSFALVVYEGLEGSSGGFRYDREIVSRLRERGDTVEVIALPWRRYPAAVATAYSPRLRSRLDRDVDVLLEDGLCHPALWRHNRRIEGPDAVVGLLHHLRSDDPTERFRSLIRPVERRFLDSLDGVVATSAFTERRARTCCPALGPRPSLGSCSSPDPRPSLVAHPAGRAEAAAVPPDTLADRTAGDPFRVVYVGSVVPRKDLRTLLEALARIGPSRGEQHETGARDNELEETRDAPVDWRLTVIGDRTADPGYADDALSRTHALGIGDRVEFLGTVPTDVLVRKLESAHVCCVPSQYEAFGMAHLEAMERGAVPVAGSVGGASEFLADGVNGLVIDPGDPAALADRLSRLATDRNLLAKIARGALATADRQPGWDAVTESLRSFCGALATENVDGRGSAAVPDPHAVPDVRIEPHGAPSRGVEGAIDP